MNQKQIDEWHLYNSCENLINSILFVKEAYCEEVRDIFAAPENEANLYCEELMKNANTEVTEPDDIRALCFRKYCLIENIQYQLRLSFICLIYQMFEQFLIAVTKRQLGMAVDRYSNWHDENHKSYVNEQLEKLEKPNNQLKTVRAIFKDYGFDFEKNSQYSQVEELGLLVNIIKHTQGPSSQQLKQRRPHIFKKSTLATADDSGVDLITDLVEIYDTSLLVPVLDIDDSDFSSYVDVLTSFLSSIPKKLQRCIDTPDDN